MKYNQNKPIITGTKVEVKDDRFEVALRKFKRKVDSLGILIEVINRQYYEKPTSVRKRKKSAARARWLKKLRDQELPGKKY
jgi:small subunit ribosomal protein S21